MISSAAPRAPTAVPIDADVSRWRDRPLPRHVGLPTKTTGLDTASSTRDWLPEGQRATPQPGQQPTPERHPHVSTGTARRGQDLLLSTSTSAPIPRNILRRPATRVGPGARPRRAELVHGQGDTTTGCLACTTTTPWASTSRCSSSSTDGTSRSEQCASSARSTASAIPAHSPRTSQPPSPSANAARRGAGRLRAGRQPCRRAAVR